jgi:hypothetical protein
MLVDNPVEFVHAKFANMCTHLEATYPNAAIDTEAMRSVGPTALFVLLRQYLLPHAEQVEAGDTVALVSSIAEPSIVALAVLCADDEKILRYLKLFCTLVA